MKWCAVVYLGGLDCGEPIFEVTHAIFKRLRLAYVKDAHALDGWLYSADAAII
jgi:hypothetical protein